VPATRLTGWREIGLYLERAPRTAQRWERDFGLPVHRERHGRVDVVYAMRSEVDTWLTSPRADVARAADSAHDAPHEASAPRPADPTRQPAAGSRRLWALAAAVLLVTLLVLWRLGLPLARDAGAAHPASTPAGAIGLYHFDEGSGERLADASPAGAHGAITNGSWVDGAAGLALDFGPAHHAGARMVAVFPGTFPFHAPARDASLSFWVRAVDGTHRTVFWTRGDPYSADANRFHIYTGGVQRMTGPAIGIDYLSPEGSFRLLFEVRITVGRWVHVALVRAGDARYTLYLDGDPAATYEDPSPQLPTYTGNWALWRMEDNPYPKQNGMVDEIALWNRALGADDVKALATSRRASPARTGP
jgi:hypothetical protein